MDVGNVVASWCCEWALSCWNDDPVSRVREQGIIRSNQLAGYNDGKLNLRYAVIFYRLLTVLGMGDYVYCVPWQCLRWKSYAGVPERHAHCSRLRILGRELS